MHPSTRQRSIFRYCALALLLSVCTISLPCLLDQAHAATIQRGDVERAASEGIVLDADLYLKEPQFDHAVSRIETIDGPAQDPICLYSYALTIPNEKGASLGETVSARWNDVGFDADDERIDLVISWLPDSKWYAQRQRSSIPLLTRYPYNTYDTAGICLGADSSASGIKTSCEEHIRINFYKSGTNDPASGSFLTKFSDLDQKGWNNTYDDRWCESIEFISGHSQDLFIPSNNVLNIRANRNGEQNTDLRATQNMEGSDLASGVVAALSNGAEFWYYSTHGFTDIFDQFDVHTIALSSDANGRIHCANKTDVVPVGWRSGRSVSIEANAGYKVSQVYVDGQDIGATDSYRFDNVTSDRSISATFSPISYAIAFHANGGDGSMSDQWLAYDSSAALSASTFSRRGYTFSEWNTQPDGSGTAYSDGAVVSNLSSQDGAKIDLYAQWRPNTYLVSFDPNAGSGVMPDRSFIFDVADALPVHQFNRAGYLFSNWNTQADGSGQTFQDTEEVSELSAEDGGRIGLFAQWSPITYQVAFDAQEGVGIMEEQELTYDQSACLDPNVYQRDGYRWVAWNTEPDGSGLSYADEQEVKNLASIPNDIITLYAQWEPLEDEGPQHPSEGEEGSGEDSAGPGDDDKPQSGPSSETGEGEGDDGPPDNAPDTGDDDPTNNEGPNEEPDEGPDSPDEDDQPFEPGDATSPSEPSDTNGPQEEASTESPLEPGDALDDPGANEETGSNADRASSSIEDDANEHDDVRDTDTGFARTGSSTALLFGVAGGCLVVGSCSIAFGIHRQKQQRKRAREQQLRQLISKP